MTVEVFTRRAQEIYDIHNGYAGEEGHIDMDNLMVDCLRSLGYGEGVKILESMSDIWYS